MVRFLVALLRHMPETLHNDVAVHADMSNGKRFRMWVMFQDTCDRLCAGKGHTKPRRVM